MAANGGRSACRRKRWQAKANDGVNKWRMARQYQRGGESVNGISGQRKWRSSSKININGDCR